MITLDCEQGSLEWFAARCGIPSASNFDKIITSTGKPSTQKMKYMYQLAGESITGIKTDSFQSEAMKRGAEMEGEAIKLYEMLSGKTVKRVGLCYPDEQKMWAASPDGLFDDIGLEIKCPLIHTHVEYLAKKEFPSEYYAQVQGGLLVTGLKGWVLMSYYPGLKPFICPVNRDEKFISLLRVELELFCSQLVQLKKSIA